MPLLENLQSNQSPIGNQNLMHVKFHVNRFHDNLLSKRLQQLDSEEMKSRLKHHRTSNELIFFLRECKKTTGYLSKMKSFQSNSFISNEDETKKEHNYLDSKSSLDMINSTKTSSFISKTCSNSHLTKNELLMTNNDLNHLKTRKKYSLDETKIECLSTLKNRIDLKAKKSESPLQNNNNRVIFFENILNTPTSSICGSQCSNLNKPSSDLSKDPTSSRSNFSSFSSNSSDSFNEVFKNVNLQKIRPITSHVTSREMLKKNSPNLDKKFNFVNKSSVSNLDWSKSRLNLELNEMTQESTNFEFMKVKKLQEEKIKSKSKTKIKNEMIRQSGENEFCSKSLSLLANYSNSSIKTNNLKQIDKLPVTSRRKSIVNSANNQSSKLPIRIKMSRSSIKKKQVEIMNEYNRFSTLELLNNLRKIQNDLDLKVKQFTETKIIETFKT